MTPQQLTDLIFKSKIYVADVPALASFLHSNLFDLGDLERRKHIFALRISDFKGAYQRTMLKDFYDYWTEISDNGKKMRFEKQKVFNTELRLKTWFKNQRNVSKNRNELEELVRESVGVLSENRNTPD